MASPFQEFLFRGWLQPRLSHVWGEWAGLLAANSLFTLWHYLAPFLDETVVPLRKPSGFISTFAAGLVYGYLFQRTKSIVALWLAHVIAGIAFIVAGVMDFTQTPF